jgi:4-hydroxy-3-polyprenylbenzoate decarboxylase
MLIWRVVNNIDALRDIWLEPFIGIDATNKNRLDGFEREWPGDVNCDRDVINNLHQRQIIDYDDSFIKTFQIY